MEKTIELTTEYDRKIRNENINKIFDEETIRSLLKSEEDIENGRTRDAIEVIKEFKEKYGIWKWAI